MSEHDKVETKQEEGAEGVVKVDGEEETETTAQNVEAEDKRETVAAASGEPPEADEFGLPVRPPRRRGYDDDEDESSEVEGRTDVQEVVNDESAKSETTTEEARTTSQKTAIQDSVTVQSPEEKVDSTERSTASTTTTSQNPAIEYSVTVQSLPEQSDQKGVPTGPPSSNTAPPDATSHPQSIEAPSRTSKDTGERPVSPSQLRKPAGKAAVSEWSHQQLAPHQDEEEEKKDDEGDWQEMPALATHRVYDDWGKVIARGYDEVDDETMAYGQLGGAGKGYTRVLVDEDAQSQTSFDDNTAYLFPEGYTRNALDEDDEARDLISQMQTTKELLTEGQRIAYVGVVRLSMFNMIEELEKIEITKGSRTVLDLATQATKMWAQKMMVRLYSHMEIDTQEQVMVEQLAEHGVRAEDLTPTLMQNARVRNPKSENAPGNASTRPSSTSPGPSRNTDSHGSPVRSSNTGTPAPGTPMSEAPPPAYEEATADQLHIEDANDLLEKKSIDLDLRWTVLCDLFLLLIADSMYDARSRTLLERVGAALAVDWQEICRFEKRVTDALEMQEQADKENWNEGGHLESRKKSNRNKRLMVMGLCTVGGGLVIGLSAGLLAPVIGAGLAAGFGAVGVAGTSSFFAGTGAAALIGTTGALTGAHIGVKASNRRTGAVKTFEYRPLHNNKRVNLIVTVSGWMTGKVDDVRLPFSTVDPVMGDIYSVHWEPEMLQSTGQTIQILATEALTQTIQQILGATVLATLMAGLSMPIVLAKLAYLIDNPWTVSCARADAAGLVLADSLVDRNLGVRPITLVGFSLGARVIFSCLRELAARGAVGLVQNVYIFGTPMVVKKDEWLRARAVVSGRFVNGYATNDWILGYLFRATSGGIMRVAGLSEIKEVPSIESINVTATVAGHMAYRGKMPALLRQVGWEVESEEFSEIEDPDPENHQKRQRELITEIEEARRQLEEKPEKKGFLSRFSRKKAAVKKGWETYDEKETRAELDKSSNKAAEKVAADNVDLMFDVDAIRREALELATQGGDIDEIKSHLQVRELQSTLPPMKISSPNASASTTPVKPGSRDGANSGQRESLRQTQSFSGSSPAINGYYSPARENVQDDRPSLSFEPEDTDARPPSYGLGLSNGYSSSSSRHASPSPAAAVGEQQRPPLRSSATMPLGSTTPTTGGTTASGNNPWAAEEEEGEVSMTFE